MKYVFIVLSFFINQLSFASSDTKSPHPLTSSSASQSTSLLEQAIALANQNNAKAQYHVGMLFNNGLGGAKKDPVQALSWFQKAADNGDALAQYKVGCYYAGQFASQTNVVVDNEKSLKLKLLAANAQYSLAQYDVALMYAQQNNWQQAVYWSKLSADQGELNGVLAYASFVMNTQNGQFDPIMAWAYGNIALSLRQQEIKSGKEQSSNNVTADEKLKSILLRLDANFTLQESEKAKAYVNAWKAKPSALTLEAKRGYSVLQELLKKAK